MTLTIEREQEIEIMDREALQSFQDAVAKVYAEFERTGVEFPYLLDGKVVHITVAQLRALKRQAATNKAAIEGRPESRG